jgi:hypothetical protein
MLRLVRWVREFARRLRVVPFEAMIAGVAVYGGLVALADFGTRGDPLNALLPAIAVHAFNVGYVAAGVAIGVGIGSGRRGMESAGLILVATAIAIRTVAMVWLIGWEAITINAVVTSLMVLAACRERHRSLVAGAVIVQTDVVMEPDGGNL